MKNKESKLGAGRRDFMKTMAMGSVAGLLGFPGGKPGVSAYEPPDL